MATFTDKRIIDTLIANNGHYEDDPQAAVIVEYTNSYGNLAWGVTWITESYPRQMRYLLASEYVINPRILWRRESEPHTVGMDPPTPENDPVGRFHALLDEFTALKKGPKA